MGTVLEGAMTSRSFHLGDILSITTGRLVSPRHIEAVYDLLNFMTGDNLFTHQLPRAMGECAEPLLRQHPDLAAVQPPEDFDGDEHVFAWLAEQVSIYGEHRDVEPLAPDDHTRIDPFSEIRRINPDAQIIAVELPEQDG